MKRFLIVPSLVLAALLALCILNAAATESLPYVHRLRLAASP